MTSPKVKMFGVGFGDVFVSGVKKVVVGGVVVYVRVGERGMRLEVERNVGEGDEVSESLGGVCRKPKLEEQHRGITEVNGSAGLLVVLNGAGNPFFYVAVLGEGATKGDGVRGGCGCVTVEGNLDGGKGRNLVEIGRVAFGNVVASKIEVVAKGGGDGVN